jgi:CotH kinase protein
MATGRVLAGAALAVIVLALPGEVAAQSADELFNDQVLHRVDLWVNTKDWAVLKYEYETNNYYPANLKWNGQTVYNVAIRSRGQGSRSGIKPGIRVDFNRYVTGRTFLGMTAVNLNNLTQDPTAVREVMAMKFYRMMGLPAPRISLAALYINNEFVGAYAIVEEIDEVSVARLFGENTGYLFEYKWKFAWGFEYLGSDLATYAPLYEPKTHKTDSIAALYAPFEAMIRTINNASDDEFVAAVSPYLDLSIFMRFVAVQAYIAECDGILGNWGLNNNFLYRFNQKSLSQFIAWDASSAFYTSTYPFDIGLTDRVLMRRAMAVPALRAIFFSTILEAAAWADHVDTPGQPGWLESELTRFQNLNRTAVYADPNKPWSNAEYDQGSADILSFARTRSALARQIVAQMTAANGPYPTTLLSVPQAAGAKKDASRTPVIRIGPRR